MNPELLPCPFCSCAALIGEVHERDDRRWMSVRVDCAHCDAFQRADIPYNEFSKMNDAEISTRLFREASTLWNKRDDLAMACVASYGKLPDPLAAAEEDLLGQFISLAQEVTETAHWPKTAERARALLAKTKAP